MVIMSNTINKNNKKQPPNSSPQGSILVWLFAIAISVNLIFGIFTWVRVNRLHTFFSTFSDDYRALSGGGGGNAPEGEIADAPSGGKQCVTIDIEQGTDPILGDPDAPVTIVEYSDFECPFCARFVTDAYVRIKSEYVDTGKARLIYKDFPLDNIHPLATPAAVVANCVAQELGDVAFFNFHDTIFAQQANLSEANLTLWATELGLSTEQVEACRNDSTLQEEIFTDINEALEAGINGTPSFIINGELLVGAQPFQSFKQAIDDALNGEGCS